jgi:hypothetical protein
MNKRSVNKQIQHWYKIFRIIRDLFQFRRNAIEDLNSRVINTIPILSQIYLKQVQVNNLSSINFTTFLVSNNTNIIRENI